MSMSDTSMQRVLNFNFFLGTWLPFDVTKNLNDPEIYGYSAGLYPIDNTSMYVAYGDIGASCVGQTTPTGRLTTKGTTPGLYIACTLGEFFVKVGFYLVDHPDLVRKIFQYFSLLTFIYRNGFLQIALILQIGKTKLLQLETAGHSILDVTTILAEK